MVRGGPLGGLSGGLASGLGSGAGVQDGLGGAEDVGRIGGIFEGAAQSREGGGAGFDGDGLVAKFSQCAEGIVVHA